MIKTLAKDQRGAGHLIILVVIVLAIVGGAGYLVYSKQKDKSSNESARDSSLAAIVSDKEVHTACKDEIDDEDYCKFASNWSGTSGSYTSTITTKMDGETSVTVIKAESDKKTSTTTTVNGTETGAYVSYDGTFYAKDYSDGKWIKYKSTADDSVSSSPTDAKSELSVDDFKNTEDSPSSITYKKLGKEACGSLTCFKYQIVDSAAPDSEQFVWFDDKDYWLRHTSSKDANGSFDMVITYGKVTVSEPSPTKDAPDLNSIMPSDLPGSTEPSQAGGQGSQGAPDN